MSQQINLINPSLIKQKDLLTPANIGLSYGVLALSMLVFYGYTNQQMDTLQQQHDKVVAELSQVQASLNQATAARAPHEPDKGLETELARLESKQQMQMQILNTINQDSSTSGQGLANYLRGFAQQSTDGLWLTGVSLDRSHHAMTIRGRSLSADLVPRYISKLSNEPIFAGHKFGGMQITRPKLDLGKATPIAGADVNTAIQTPTLAPYIDFELHSLDTGLDESQGSAADQASNVEQVKS